MLLSRSDKRNASPYLFWKKPFPFKCLTMWNSNKVSVQTGALIARRALRALYESISHRSQPRVVINKFWEFSWTSGSDSRRQSHSRWVTRPVSPHMACAGSLYIANKSSAPVKFTSKIKVTAFRFVLFYHELSRRLVSIPAIAHCGDKTIWQSRIICQTFGSKCFWNVNSFTF